MLQNNAGTIPIDAEDEQNQTWPNAVYAWIVLAVIVTAVAVLLCHYVTSRKSQVKSYKSRQT